MREKYVRKMVAHTCGLALHALLLVFTNKTIVFVRAKSHQAPKLKEDETWVE
jgi:hypothetical protein